MDTNKNKILILKQVMLKSVYKSIKIEFEYDSRVKNISKHTSKLVWTCSIQVQSTKYISAVPWGTCMFVRNINVLFENIWKFSHFWSFLKNLEKINLLFGWWCWFSTSKYIYGHTRIFKIRIFQSSYVEICRYLSINLSKLNLNIIYG